MEKILAQIGLFSISVSILYIMKKVSDYLDYKKEKNYDCETDKNDDDL